MSPYELGKKLRLIKHYVAGAEAWTHEARRYSGQAAENVRSYARHLQTLAECLNLDLLEDQLLFQYQRKIIIWP